MRRAALLLIVLTFALLGVLRGTAEANDNDFRLYRLGGCTAGTTAGPSGDSPCQADLSQGVLDDFKTFTRAVGQVFAPSFLNTAETLGQAGFAFGFETKFVAPADGDHWRALNGQAEGDNSAPLFTLLQMNVRKGLPFSLELETTLSWLSNSEMWWIGGGVKWTLLEALNMFVPDLAVRGFGGTVIGAPDLNLTTAGFDVVISKPIGIAGLVSLTPYAGYSMLWAISSSRVLDADPTFSATPSGAYQPEFLFEEITEVVPRGFAGARFNISYATVSAEYGFNFDFDVHTIAIKVGGDF